MLFNIHFQVKQIEQKIMRRLSTPRKSQKDFQSSQLSYVVNNLLMGNLNTQQHCTFLTVSSPPQPKHTKGIQKTSSNKREISQEPRNKYLTNHNLTDFNFKSQSAERRNLRPKTSLVSSKIAYNSGANSLQKKYETMKPLSAKRAVSHEKFQQNNKNEQYKMEIKLLQNEATLQKLASKPPKSITSSKPVGLVRGYSVNSHKFFVLGSEISQARILVIANLTKTSRVQSIVSLYAIFESNNSPVFVDFLRENFQSQISPLLQGFPTPAISKQLIQKCMMKVQEKFYHYYKIRPRTSKRGLLSNHFGLSFSLMFSSLNSIKLFTRGTTQISISSNLGAKMYGVQNQNLEMRAFEGKQLQSLDLIMITSEGASFGNRQTMRQIWFSILRTISSNDYKLNINEGQQTHSLLGGAVDSIMQRFSTVMTFKNMSVILCGMRNFEQTLCLDSLTLEIPFVDSGKNNRQTECEKDDFQQL